MYVHALQSVCSTVCVGVLQCVCAPSCVDAHASVWCCAALDLSRNELAYLVPGCFGGFTAQQVLSADLSFNALSQLDTVGVAVNTQAATLNRAYNSAERLCCVPCLDHPCHSVCCYAQGLLRGFNGLFLNLTLQSNSLTSLGGIFDGFLSAGQCHLDFSHNTLATSSITTALQSFTLSVATLNLDFSFNQLTMVPGNMFCCMSA